MPLMLTRAGLMGRLGGYRHQARGLLGRATGALRADSTFGRTLAVGASAFGFGLLQGKYRDKGGATLFGLPADLLAGAGAHILALLPIGQVRSFAPLLRSVGDGALAAFATTSGYRVGERWAKGGSLTSGIAGLFGDSASQPVSGGASIADRELASLVRADS